MSMSQEEMTQMLRNHQTALYGNGRPGLIETLASVTASVKSMESGVARLMDLAGETKEQVTTMAAQDTMARETINSGLDTLKESQDHHAEVVERRLDEAKNANSKEHDLLSGRINPLEKFNTRYIYTTAALSGATFFLGITITFIVVNWDNLMSIMSLARGQ